MKKLWIVIGVLLLGKLAWATTTQPNAIGIVTAIIENKTIAQMEAYVPASKGQLLYCSDCLQSAVCVASGTVAGSWVVATATSTAVLGGLIGHCK